MEWLLFVLGALTVGASLFLGYRERRDFARLQERASRTRPGELEELSLVVADLEQELTQTAERIIQDLEERTAALRRLIAEAKAISQDLKMPAVSEPAREGETPPTQERAANETNENTCRAPEEKPQAKGWRTTEATVLELSQQGLGVEQIARQLNIGKGEVKLILNLRKAQAR
ncbi:MAG: DUF6115 domain-containing protein [Betaproteobacteria bacterium]